MSHRYSKYLTPISIVGDLLILNGAFLLAYLIKFSKLSNVVSTGYLDLLIYINIIWLSLMILYNSSQANRALRFAKVVRMMIGGIILHLLLTLAFITLYNISYYSREQIALTYLLFTLFLFIWRGIYIYSIRLYRKRGFNYRSIVVVGHGELSNELERYFRAHPEYGYKLIGYFDKKAIGKNILGDIKDMFQYLPQNNIDEIYCCLPYVRYSQIKKIIDFAEENLIKVKLIADFRGFSFKGLELERYDYIPVLNVTSIPLDDKKNLIVKRIFDVAFSGMVILLIFSWLFPIIAIFILIDSKGPVFFKQKRTGKGNKTFWCWKFRTMTVNKSADSLQATKNDTRITNIGSILRKTSIDELPQFLNVFNGTMSVVGPRPHMLKHTDEYSKVVEKFMARHFVKPGITGLAQAKGYRGETKTIVSIKNRVKLDRFYIENWSIILDIKIILLTISSLLKGDENAY
jgi:putative colanic acid biosysnthesis UDP-glucose lipid carrier transferase